MAPKKDPILDQLPDVDPQGRELKWVSDTEGEWIDNIVAGEKIPHEHVAGQYQTWTCTETGQTIRMDRENPDYVGPITDPEEEGSEDG